MTQYLIKHSVRTFEIVSPYTIKVRFEDETTQIINFKAVLGGGMYRPLGDPDFFSKVFISDGIATLTWHNGADYNPDHLYDWPAYKSLYQKHVKEWENIEEKQHT